MSNTKTITVQGVKVDVSLPYSAGHAINEAEAKSLNQTRAENIANNKRKEIKDMLEVEGATEESVQGEAQAIVADYDKTYEFTLASVGGGSSRLDPVEKEALSIARAWISGELKKKGMTQKEYLAENGEDAIKNKTAELAERPEVIAAAKKNLKARENLTEMSL